MYAHKSMTTVAIPKKLRDKLKSMKLVDSETYSSVIERIVEEVMPSKRLVDFRK